MPANRRFLCNTSASHEFKKSLVTGNGIKIQVFSTETWKKETIWVPAKIIYVIYLRALKNKSFGAKIQVSNGYDARLFSAFILTLEFVPVSVVTNMQVF